MNGETLAETLLDSVNSGINSEDLAETVASGHQHLQQEVFRQVLKPIICEYARQYDQGNYDKRNESTLETCNKIAEKMDWYY